MYINQTMQYTGDIRVDALLANRQDSLFQNHQLGTAVTLTYSTIGFTVDQAASISAMLAEVSSVVGITFRPVSEGGILSFNWFEHGSSLANGDEASGFMRQSDKGAQVYLNKTMSMFNDLNGGIGRQVTLHETLHALGLKHPGHYSEADNGPTLPDGWGTTQNTIMAYSGGATTGKLGAFDIQTLQYLYGPAHNTVEKAIVVTGTSTGGSAFDDVFTFDTALGFSARVMGGAGMDTLELNVASTSAKFLKGDTVIYYKPDGQYAGVQLDSVERIHFTDKSVALDITGNAGDAYRLYEAAFNRKPDLDGLGFWINQLDCGMSTTQMAQGFIDSREFKLMYGASNSTAFVNKLYNNVLDRAPDAGGLSYWVNQLDHHTLTPAEVLTGFSESNENQIALAGVLQAGIDYHLA